MNLFRQATDVAGLCREIVLRTAQTIQGRRYVRVEGWQAIATAHGTLVSVSRVEAVAGGVRAIAQLKRMQDGLVLAEAEGFVGDDEQMWARRPMYARRAMASTRAISRVCRSAFAYIVVMIDSDLATTPAEEMPDYEQEERSRPSRQALPARPPRQSHPPHDPDEVGAMVDSISGATYTRLAKLVRDGHYTPDRFKVDFPHLKSTSQLTETEGVALVARIEADLALREEERQLAEEALREPGDDTEEGVLLA